MCRREKPLQHIILDGFLLFCWATLVVWLHEPALLSRFLSYVEVLSLVHSDCWVAAGTTGSGTRFTTRSSCLHAGHREYRNQDLASCKRIPVRGAVSSLWALFYSKKLCSITLSS